MSDNKDRIGQTLEVLVYAPIGMGMYVKDMGPTFVARGRAELDRRQAQIQQRTTAAKGIGQVVVGFGVPMVRQRVEREVDTARQRALSFLTTIGGSSPSDAPPVTPVPRPAAPKNGTETRTEPAATTNGASTAPAGDTLPIPGYDALSASQVVERLTGLSGDELDAVRAYEGAHRNRRTILGKIDQISA